MEENEDNEETNRKQRRITGVMMALLSILAFANVKLYP